MGTTNEIDAGTQKHVCDRTPHTMRTHKPQEMKKLHLFCAYVARVSGVHSIAFAIGVGVNRFVAFLRVFPVTFLAHHMKGDTYLCTTN